ncbi:hypothetical protein [Sphingomonas morindae]|uniref:Glycosyl transferase n=1 Tax=Sphingomonas morindae TaxID=1541170 RepID=A0ABY4X961_9SPHN|nr:hypothetical protein [Sphingomonas morindae]USI73413.1 hypothetical protein LHA26_02730 [Sphingomonas morindae]
MRIGFLLNHDQTHQIAHSLPIALALAEADPGLEIIVAVTSDRIAAEVARLAGPALRSGAVTLRRLGIERPGRRRAARWLGGLIPAAKLLVYGDNLPFFEGLDLLVVSEKTSLLLKTHYGLDALRIVHTRHGAGDRAIGFDRASAGFDLVLVAGEKIRARLIEQAGVAPERIRIVGYPKFDLAPGHPAPFAADPGDRRPIILYNPHVSPHLSSWYRMGPRILDWFVAQSRYRLIFAPHVMLFHRKWVVTIDRLSINRPGRLADAVRAAPHIHVDLGSPASTDMTYTEAADLYLGDVSSQVYEFMRRPRPIVALDAHGLNPAPDDPDFAHWAAGPVVRDLDALGPALDEAFADRGGRYAAVQRRLLERTFSCTGERASIRAAQAILDYARTTGGDRVAQPAARRRNGGDRRPLAPGLRSPA